MSHRLKSGNPFKIFLIFASLVSLGTCTSQDTSLPKPPTIISPNETPGYDNHRSAGSSATDLLSDETFHTAVIEIQAMQGFEPTTETQNNLKTFVAARLNKSSGVQILMDTDIAPAGQSSYTLEDVAKLEAANRVHFTSLPDGIIYVYFLFLDGASSDDSGSSQILGYAYQNTSMAIFEKTIGSLSGGLTQPPTAIVETTVLEHEFSHLMGLVNVGSPPQSAHQDTAHGAHCNVTSCLMYYAVDTSNIIANLLGGSVPDLDSACLADLKANGGK